MPARKFFGTDGIRGLAGEYPMTAEFALALGAATGEALRSSEPTSPPTVLIGRDTRRSGPMLAAALAAGLASRGAEVVDLGVFPTPGVSQLVLSHRALAGAVISASHNPYADNGIKLFGSDGEKLPDELEAALEARIGADAAVVSGSALGSIRHAPDASEAYVQFLLSHAPFLDGLRLGLDTAHGAAYQIAPRVFKKIGARVDLNHAQPTGENINEACGSTHPEALMARVQRLGLEVGIAFDGDADRALLVDRRGRLVSGDHILAICALVGGQKRVVATSMTNLGVERYLAAAGVGMLRVQVGDRYVLEALKAEGLTLGGEQSGHLLFRDIAPTGDGILTALQVLAAVRASGKPLEAWLDEIPVYPQALANVRVPRGAQAELLAASSLQRTLQEAEAALGDHGRVLLRASGTEPLIRVMVEAAEAPMVQQWVNRLVAGVQAAAGVADA
jgi:phosphoglucosamine mutase